MKRKEVVEIWHRVVSMDCLRDSEELSPVNKNYNTGDVKEVMNDLNERIMHQNDRYLY